MGLTFRVPPEWGRWTGFALFTAMLGFQGSLWFKLDGSWVSLTRWTLVTLLFLLFWSAYLVRRPLKAGAHDWKEWALPFFCAGLPFAIMMLPSLFFVPLERYCPLWSATWIWPLIKNLTPEPHSVGLWLMAVGEALTIWGMINLRGNFSIATEVRDWVQTGPYRWIRHPLYAGEILSVWGYAIFWPSLWSLSGALCFHLAQFLRARMEEQKLLSVYPDYKSVQKNCGMFWPRWRKCGKL